LSWQGERFFHVSEDAFRLAAQLRAVLCESDKTLLCTGAGSHDGTSTIAAQIALAFAHMGMGSVLLLDANLRAPSVHTMMQVPQSPGFTDLVEKRATLDDVVQATPVHGFYVLPVGSAVRDALALFPSAACTAVLHLLAQRFRLVIIDTAPVLQHVDTTMFMAHTDGVVLVVAAGVRRQGELLEIKRLLDAVKARLLGVVLSDKTGRFA
jgi:capsular exopolysaccharide synthesis family protein